MSLTKDLTFKFKRCKHANVIEIEEAVKEAAEDIDGVEYRGFRADC